MSKAAHESCLVAKFSHYIQLSERQENLLRALEKKDRPFVDGEIIYQAGDENEFLYVVRKGWLHGYTLLPDGGRLVVRVYNAGDVIGFPGLAYGHYSIDLAASTDGALCPFEKDAMDEIFQTSPKLTAMFFTLSAREETILVDTLRAASRMRPMSRLAYFLLDLIARLRITNTTMTNRFRLPLTQSVIGDALGLTNVTVSRVMSEMQSAGLIGREQGFVTLLREDQLEEICDFRNRYADMDTSWFPSVGE